MTFEEILVPIVMFDIFESDDLLKMADFVLRTDLAESGEDEVEEVNNNPD